MLAFYVMASLSALVCSAFGFWPAAIIFALVALGVCGWAEARCLRYKYKQRARRRALQAVTA